MGHGNTHAHEHHIIPIKVYLNVFVSLLILTAITVGIAQVDLGRLNTIIAFFVATIKASLVLAFFMHLKYDAKINRWIVFSAVSFVFLLWLISILDIYTRIAEKSTL